MATIGDEITAALQDLNLLAAGRTPAADDSALALSRVNDWIDGLATEPLTIHQITRSTWTITTASSYTVGTGATVSVARPDRASDITNIGYQDTSVSPTLETLFGRVLTEDEYEGIAQKGLTGVYPQAWYYSPTVATGTLKPWPVPTGSSLQGVIYTRTPLAEFTALTDTITLPRGYRRFFRTNLLIEMADAFNADVSPRQERLARESKSAIKRTNMRHQDLIPDYPRSASTYDINRDA